MKRTKLSIDWSPYRGTLNKEEGKLGLRDVRTPHLTDRQLLFFAIMF